MQYIKCLQSLSDSVLLRHQNAMLHAIVTGVDARWAQMARVTWPVSFHHCPTLKSWQLHLAPAAAP